MSTQCTVYKQSTYDVKTEADQSALVIIIGEVEGIKEEEKQEGQEQALVQIKTRKYSATPIKDVAGKGKFVLSMARKTSVDVSADNLMEIEDDSRQKIRSNKPGGDGVCFTCCSSS